MTLAARLKSKNARVRYQARLELRMLEQLAEELGRKRWWWVR